jgi:hypothetical protein
VLHDVLLRAHRGDKVRRPIFVVNKCAHNLAAALGFDLDGVLILQVAAEEAAAQSCRQASSVS